MKALSDLAHRRSFALASPSQSLDIHKANEASQRRPAVMMPSERRILHLTDPADPLRS